SLLMHLINFSGDESLKRDFIVMSDISPAELFKLLKEARKMKIERGKVRKDLAGKTIAMIFEKPSTRTRVSFEVGIRELGGNVIFLGTQEMQLSRGETIFDTAKTLSRYVHGIIARVSAHETLVEFAKYSDVPVINALSPLEHPCQALADLLTIYEKKGKLKGVKLAWIGDGNNVCNSLLIACGMTGMNISVATPKGYEPPVEIVKKAKEFASKSGSKIEILNDPRTALIGAEVVYTDVFVSMGQEKEKEKRMRDFSGFKVTEELMSFAEPDAIFMHCLPAHRGEEVDPEVIDGPKSVVFDQAENRLHAQKALLKFLIT
ncbi:MAG: ornithine carbamoyltransferase, partial [Candidatus Hadarchaeales archaeon]